MTTTTKLQTTWKHIQNSNKLISYEDWLIEFENSKNIKFSCPTAAKIIYLKKMLENVGGMPKQAESNDLKNFIILALYSLSVAGNDTYANNFISGKRSCF